MAPRSIGKNSFILLLFGAVLCAALALTSCGKLGNKTPAADLHQNSITTEGALDSSQTPRDHVSLSAEEEVKWMKFCRDAFSFESFERDSPPDDRALIRDVAFYLLFRYDGPDREQLLNEADNCAISKEAVDRFSEEFFGRRIKVHQSVMGFEYVDGKYYPAGMDDHNFKTTHIQKFTDNGDGTYTIEYDFYMVLEDELEGNVLAQLKPEEFVNAIHERPQDFPPPFAEGRILVKKVKEDGRERYIILENIKKRLPAS